MHDFNYRHNNLFCESVSIEGLARKYGTPLYVYSRNTLISHYRKLKEAFKPVSPLICYSMKANSNLSICKALVEDGAGLDIVSGGELYRALKAGVAPEKIVYAGVGKTEKEIEMAIRRRIFLFNVESIPELRLINKVAGVLRVRQKVAIRINPDVKAKTHKYITTGHGENKFGIDFETAKKIFLERKAYQNLDISGIHMHIGSQIIEDRPFVKAISRVVDFIRYLEGSGIGIRWLNIGGGLGIIYSREAPQTAKEYAKAVFPILKKVKADIILEPGRFIVGNAGVMVTRVQYIKETPNKNFAIVDAGMNDLIRPSLYGAYHEILPVRSRSYSDSKDVKIFDVVGPICESGDFLGKDRKFIGLKEGDLLSVMGIGAYGSSMASNYNSRPRACGVMVEGSKVKLIRRRETCEDLIRAET